MSINIFISYHKPDELYNLPKEYKTIFVGKDCKYVRLGYETIEKNIDYSNKFFKQINYYDNVGNNISYQNNYVSELTSAYWVWKNLKFNNEDYIGFCAYRRIINYPPDYKNYNVLTNYYGNKPNETIKDAWILPFLYDDYPKLLRIITNEFPEDYIKFKRFERELMKNMPLRNNFLMKYPYFDEYCSRLFAYNIIFWKRKDEWKLYGHMIEIISSFILWDLGAKNELHYISPSHDGTILYK